MYQKLKGNKKGFTLAELLIVIAIIAILMAIAIPLYASQLRDARIQVDVSTARSAASLASAQFMLDKKNAQTVYGFDASGANLVITGVSGDTGYADDVTVTLDATGKFVSATIKVSEATGSPVTIPNTFVHPSA